MSKYKTGGDRVPSLARPRFIAVAVLAVFACAFLFGAVRIASASDAGSVEIQKSRQLRVKKVSIGSFDTLAVTEGGYLFSWGKGDHWRSESASIEPSIVRRVSDVVDAVSGENVDAAITSSGTLYMAGSNHCGQLGNGTHTGSGIESVMDDVKQVAIGKYSVAAVKSDGSLWTWGMNGSGQLGSGTEPYQLEPVKVMDGVVQVGMGDHHGVALKSDGSLWTWGSNLMGQLCDDTNGLRPEPAKVADGVRRISVGPDLTAVIKTDGRLYYSSGEAKGLKAAEWSDRLGEVASFSDQGAYTAVVTAKGELYVWDTSRPSVIEEVPDLGQVKSVAEGGEVGQSRTYGAINSNGWLYMWGGNGNGQVGDGTTTDRDNPVPIVLGINEVTKPTIYYGDQQKEELDKPFEDIVRERGAREYNPNLSSTLMYLAHSVYDEKNILNTFESLGLQLLVEDYHDSGIPAYAIAKKPLDDGSTLIFVAVRGTITDKDLLTDLDLGALTTFANGKHNGFQSAADRIYNQISASLGGVQKGNVTYVLTGHSLGAGVANLLAVKLGDEGVPNTCVYDYNFACPDVANKVGFDWNPSGVHDNIFNVCNSLDSVAYIPGVLGDAVTSLPPFLNPWNLISAWGKFGRTGYFDIESFDYSNPKGIREGDEGFMLLMHSVELYEEYLDLGRDFGVLHGFDAGRGARTTASLARCIPALASGQEIAVRCPVDVTVYDGSGSPVASVIDGEVDYHGSRFGDVVIAVNGDEKCIVVPMGNYRVELTATGDGEMDYAVAIGNLLEGGSSVETKEFESVALETGKRMTGEAGPSLGGEVANLYVVDKASGVPVSEIREDGAEVPATDVSVDMYRMYNSNTGEHLYTASATERDTMVGNGWTYEGVMWRAPKTSSTPIWRLYNPNNGDHHYARTRNEYYELLRQGWKGEGVAFYSAGTDGVPIYRLFNPNQTGAGSHHYTDSEHERDVNVSQGWRYEDVGWYGLR